VTGWVIPRDALSPHIHDKRRSARRDVRGALKRARREVAVGLAVGVVFPVLLASRRSRERRNRRAVTAARDIVSFSNMVEHLTVEARGGTAAPPLEIVEDSTTRKFSLREFGGALETTSESRQRRGAATRGVERNNAVHRAAFDGPLTRSSSPSSCTRCSVPRMPRRRLGWA
jgi:hypothetical protein